MEYYIENKENIRHKAYYQENIDKIKNYQNEYNKTYRNKNKDYFIDYNKCYKENNKEYFKEERKKYYSENKERMLINQREYYLNNRERISERVKNYRKENKDIINKNQMNRKKSDVLFRLKCSIRTLISSQIKKKNIKKSKKTDEILGCSFENFKIYIELKFNNNMNWDNYGSYWHLDHIIPISWANSEYQVYELNRFTNFQPLYWIDNLSKGNRFEG